MTPNNSLDPITGEDWMKARIERLEAEKNCLQQLVYCEIGLTWKSVALDRLKIIQEKSVQLDNLRGKLQAVKGTLAQLWALLEEK